MKQCASFGYKLVDEKNCWIRYPYAISMRSSEFVAYHFKNCMYNNPSGKSRLLSSSVPISYEGHQVQCHTDVASVPSTSRRKEHGTNVDSPVPSKKIKVLQVISIPSTFDTGTPSTVECLDVQQPLQSPVGTQTSKVISSHTPRRRKLKQTISILQTQNKKLKKELEQVVQPSEENFLQLADKYLNPEMARFIRAQVHLHKTSKFSRQYTDELKRFALTIYFLGPSCYKYLQNIFLLPSARSLSLHVEKIKFSAGYNKVLF